MRWDKAQRIGGGGTVHLIVECSDGNGPRWLTKGLAINLHDRVLHHLNLNPAELANLSAARKVACNVAHVHNPRDSKHLDDTIVDRGRYRTLGGPRTCTASK